MIIIDDSGSTKNNWCLFENKGVTEYFSAHGINPFFRNTVDIANELLTDFMPKTVTEIRQVHFCGARTNNPKKGEAK